VIGSARWFGRLSATANPKGNKALWTRMSVSNIAQNKSCVTSGLNFTQNHRFEFAVAAAAGAVD
jgi:hypothetical protein